jgi:hypothetical protein
LFPFQKKETNKKDAATIPNAKKEPSKKSQVKSKKKPSRK